LNYERVQVDAAWLAAQFKSDYLAMMIIQVVKYIFTLK
jgi:hypothetical protein